MSNWMRVRFFTKADDYRPIYVPPAHPVGPWWCTGESADGSAVIVAYVKTEEELYRQWPEAESPDVELCSDITFTSRFPKPDWWQEPEDA